MVKIKVFVTRDEPLNLGPLNLVSIDNATVPFDIKFYEQRDDAEPRLFETYTFTPDEQPIPPEPQPEPEPNLLYCSNRDGKWDNGQKRTVTKSDGDIKPNGKGLYMAASGDPKLEIMGNGEAVLICKAGHGRFYVMANHYNALLEKEFKIMDGNVDNVSDKLRSNHQEGGDCEQRFGGVGGSISLDESGCKLELCHNVHGDSKSADLPKPLKIGEWYKDRFQIRDSQDGKAILATRWIDYGDGKGFTKVLDHKMTKIKPYMMDRQRYEKKSYFWLRMNNESGVGKIGFRNVKLYGIPDQDAPA